MEKYKDELPPPTEAERIEEARGGYPFIPSRLNWFLCDKEDLAANEPDDSAPVASVSRNLRIATKEQLWRRRRETSSASIATSAGHGRSRGVPS
jgi:hypothetical protein